MKTHYRKNSFLPVTAALALLANHATAATFTWTGATSGTWNVATNWTGGIPAVANTTDVIISGTTNVGGMLAGSQSYTVKSLIFDGTNDANTSLTLQTTGNGGSGSRALTFSSDSGNATLTVAADSTGDKTLNRGGTFVADIVLTSSLDIVQNGSGNLTFGSQINTTGAGGINKSGTGTLLLAGSNTYTGATTITTGTLSLGSGGTTGRLTATSAITNNSNLTINRSDAFTQATDLGAGVAITGAGSFTQAGAGTTTLTAANTYTGATAVNAGTLTLASTGSIAASSSVAIGAAGSLDTTAKVTNTISGAQPLAFGIDAAGSGSSGKVVAAGLDISSAVVTYNITGTPNDPVYVLATYTSLTGTFATVPAPPTGYTLNYAYEGNKIALVQSATNNYASWANANGIPGEPASGDFENDGITNIVEYALGTSPTVSTQPAGVLSGNVITFTKGTNAIANGDVSWVIETSQTLAAGSWTAVVTQPAADPALTISYTLTPSTPEKNFARLKVIQTP